MLGEKGRLQGHFREFQESSRGPNGRFRGYQEISKGCFKEAPVGFRSVSGGLWGASEGLNGNPMGLRGTSWGLKGDPVQWVSRVLQEVHPESLRTA